MWIHKWCMVVNLSVLMLLELGSMGCATKSDLGKLRQDVASDVRTATQEVRTLRGKLENLQTSSKEERTSVTTLEADLKALKMKLDVVSDELIRQTGTINKALNEVKRQRASDREDLQAALGTLRKDLAELQEERAAFRAHIERLQTFTTTLVRAYRLELERVRGHVKDVEQVAKEMERFVEGSPKKNR
jgi:chromosome segregation ATPase